MKILIVDDDKNILDMIEHTVPWNTLSIDTVLTALDGESALKIVRENHPDIVVTDIEMPVMDGIALAEQITALNGQQPELIFLTAHAEFEYARQAIRFGAADYLLKPFLPEDLTALLSKIVVRRNEKQEQKELTEKGELFEKSQDYLLVSFFRDVLDHAFGDSPEKIGRAAAKRNIALDIRAQYRIVAFSALVEEKLKEYSPSDIQFIFQNIGCEVIWRNGQVSGECYLDTIDRSRCTAYLLMDTQKHTRAELAEKCARLVKVLKVYLDLQTLCVISEPVCLERLAVCRDEIDAFFFYNLTGKTGVLFKEDLDENSTSLMGKINQREVMNFLREQKKNDLFSYMRHFLEQNERQLNPAEMKVIHHDLIQVFYGYLYENHISTHDFIKDSVSQAIQASAEKSSVNMMKYVTYMYDCVMQCIDEVKKSESVVEKAKKYISQHFSENIGRAEIAEEVMLAPNYFSMLFHKETGQTIREYINLCRVEEAKRLLSATSNSITDIALQVGFDNISYFSTVFKKYTNVSPVEYRSQL